MRDIIRRCRFTPFRKGAGARYTLTLWYTGRTRPDNGAPYLGYRLAYRSPNIRHGRETRVLFEGEDFGCSPMWCIDSDDTVASLMSFLTLRPGDTDADYFKDYTREQMEFAETDAEALGAEVMFRFPEHFGIEDA